MFQPQLPTKAVIGKYFMVIASEFVANMLLGQGLLYYLEFPTKSCIEKTMLELSTPKHIVHPKTHCFPQGADTFLSFFFFFH